MSVHRDPRLKKGIRTGILITAILLISIVLIAPALARPPGPEFQAQYLLPHLTSLNSSVRDHLLVTRDSVSVSLFPNLTPYHRFQDIEDTETGRTMIAESWYFDSSTDFSEHAPRLLAWLNSHGTVSNTTLDIRHELEQYCVSQELATFYVDTMHYPFQNIPIMEYRSNETAGYFVILPGHMRIAYFGMGEPGTGLENTTILRIIMMTTVPQNALEEFSSSPASPSPGPDLMGTTIPSKTGGEISLNSSHTSGGQDHLLAQISARLSSLRSFFTHQR
jgi:hypothetical protein